MIRARSNRGGLQQDLHGTLPIRLCFSLRIKISVPMWGFVEHEGVQEPSASLRRSSRVRKDEPATTLEVQGSNLSPAPTGHPLASFCPIENCAWAPVFPVEDLTLEQLVQAAADLRNVVPTGALPHEAMEQGQPSLLIT
jgi:hypothetical protein